MKFLEHIAINPEVTLIKGNKYPFVDMASLSTHSREPNYIGEKIWGSGVKFQQGDTVIARIEPCLQNGKRFYCKNIHKGFGSTEYLVFRPKDKSVNSAFLYYFMQQDFIRQKMIKSMSGATGRQRVNNAVFNELEISLPPLETQQKIASILSAYDDLIENNRRQIKLLEEAAQRLYKEWFVDLRFPGHENVKIIDGVPEGWRKGTLGEIAIDAGTREVKKNREKYKYYLPIDCLPKKSLSYTTFNNIDKAESSLIAFQKGDILFGAMRPYFHKVVIARDNGLTRSTCFAINAISHNIWGFLAMLLFNTDTVDYATQISVGTTMPYVRWKDFIRMPITIPNIELFDKLNEQIEVLIGNSGILADMCIYLTEARDRLLPKLMSGEIKV